MDLLAHGADKVVMRQNESLKTKLLAACIERNEARGRVAKLRESLRDALCPVCKYSIGFRPQATEVSAEWPNCDGCKVSRAALAAAQE